MLTGPRRAPWLLVLWVALNFAWTLPFAFTEDDFLWIYGASRAGERPETVLLPPAFGGGFLRPLVQASFALDYGLAGTWAPAYRALNLCTHAATVVLLWSIYRRIAGDGWVPLIAAAAFAVHPDCASAVVWISGRTEVLCGLFYAAAVLAFLRRSWLGVLCFALALSAKESAISLPLLLGVLTTLGVREERPRSGGREWVAYVSVALLYLLARFVLLRDFATNTFDFAAAGGLAAFARTKITLVGQYLLAPLPVQGFGRSLLLLSGGTALALFATRGAEPRLRRAIYAGIAWAAVALLPYLPWFVFLPWYTYLATMGTSLGIAAVGAALIARVTSPRRPTIAAAVGATIWLVASAVVLQNAIGRERAAGERMERVVSALAEAGKEAVPPVVLVIDGLQADALGAGVAAFGRPVLAYGLSEAVRLRLGRDFIDVEHGDLQHAKLRAFRTRVLFLQWNEPRQRFDPSWRSY